MDKPIAKKPVYYRYRWHIAGGIAFIVLLIYVGIAASGGRKLRTDAENLIIGEATSDKFLEYVDVEGVVQPILTIQINTREAGSVDRIIAEEGTMMNKGDTILTLNNPDLIRAIEDQQDEWEKQLISYQEKEIEMEQKSIDLQQKTLQTTYELNRLKKSYALDEEEFNMGVKSKAQLEVARDEFDYKTRSTALQLEGLRHDSAATILRRELMKNDLERERKKFERVRERMEDLVVRAPLSGQLSFCESNSRTTGAKYRSDRRDQSPRSVQDPYFPQRILHRPDHHRSTRHHHLAKQKVPAPDHQSRSGSQRPELRCRPGLYGGKPGERTHRKKFPCPDRTRTTGRGPRHPTW